ncbi:MAG: hypothetical protein BroJett011_62700 [Chloroflexota bacterium]|nr:MAG: hypothetical protein BroJett011_62700 [Chloroflexota bacterium]
MPDLRPIESFTSQMARLETRYLKEIGQPLKEARLILFEALMRDAANLAVVARREFGALHGSVRAVASGYLTPLEETVLALTEKEFDLVSRFYPDQPASVEQARQVTAGRRREILTGFGQYADAWLDTVEAQFLVELSRLLGSGEDPQAIADRLLAEEIAAGRASVWRNGQNLAALESQRGLWEAGAALTGVLYLAGQAQMEERWRKQAIAAIDERTTDCCLRVHGQIKDLDQPFVLTGTPRFADEMQSPPFHLYCRTAQALWLERFEAAGITTARMRDAARAELEAREDGSRQEIHPAHATSRRG